MQFPPELLTNCKNMNWLELAACDLCSRKIKDPITPTKALKGTWKPLCPPFPCHPPSQATKLRRESQGSIIEGMKSLSPPSFPPREACHIQFPQRLLQSKDNTCEERCHPPRPCARRDCHLLAHPRGRWRRQHHLQMHEEQPVLVGLEMQQRFPAACYPPDAAVKSAVSKHPLISSAREDTHQPHLEKVISTRVGS